MAAKDIVSKHILKRIALEMAHQLFKLDITDAELLDTEFQRIDDRRADLLLHVKAPDSYLLHIEIQNNNHPQMALRMLRYFVDIAFAYPDKPIHQYVVYIGRDNLRMSNSLQMQQWHYEYNLLDVRCIDCQAFLEQNNPDALVLAILCDFKQQDKQLVVRKIVQRLYSLLRDNESGWREYFKMLEILSENRDLQQQVYEEERMLSEIDITRLPSYKDGWQHGHQEGRQEGRQEGKHEFAKALLWRLLEQKFGQMSDAEAVQQKIMQANDEQLMLWATRVLTANTLDEVFQD